KAAQRTPHPWEWRPRREALGFGRPLACIRREGAPPTERLQRALSFLAAAVAVVVVVAAVAVAVFLGLFDVYLVEDDAFDRGVVLQQLAYALLHQWDVGRFGLDDVDQRVGQGREDDGIADGLGRR